ncbi:MAG: threonine/serine dehydratase [Verrucomicrobiota bacterium]
MRENQPVVIGVVSFDDIRAAHGRIEPLIRRTPVLHAPDLCAETGAAEIWLKCENLQHVGAFKARGACNAVMQLQDADAAQGVIAHSSGNHAAALARAAKLRGIEATLVMPHNSRPNKIANVRRFGARIEFCEPDAESRQRRTDEILADEGGEFIHPYNDARIIAGQGTAAFEWTEQSEPLDIVITPVGGGGLLSGTLLALKAKWPKAKVIAAEPAWADDAARSLESGKIEQPTRYDTMADGLRTPLGELTFPIIQQLLDDILLASEEAIQRATDLFFNDAKLVVEPSGAVGLATMLEHPKVFEGKRVGLLISGGNLESTS